MTASLTDAPDVDEADGRGARDPRDRRGRRKVAGVKRLAWTVVAILAVVGAIAVSWFTPLMSVRSIDVSGADVLEPAQIISTAAIPMGKPLLQVDTAPAAARIAAIPRVKTVRVQRSYPSGIDITIVERVPVAFVARSGQWHLVDVDGVDFAQQKALPRLPRLTDDRSTDSSADRAALSVVAGLPADLRGRVIEVGADGPAGVTLTLAGGKKVIWGDDEDGPAKARTLGYLLTRDGTEYNVSAPQFPTYR
ncbi:cell division protein FtsQ/DivIB [Williamsia deligens]|uniref:Cell division protein FtsQ/DivIB n=1 Tax=Williamsia deligens TaxID=321325 RepID=A0ABW3GA04_9NOCA|nr:FtsQ-type POTRA domain-containing protein [Williamsia deligens]MCP2195872.1 cell division protein FtsQ [Williamsia deligens]